MNKKTPAQEYLEMYEKMSQLCAEQGWGDPFSYARSKEIYAALSLGHTVSETLSGADAYNAEGEPVEYKSTISNTVRGSYTGISVFQTWTEQEKYLKEEKIAKYPEHYYNRFDSDTGKLIESWKMTGEDVLRLILPKIRKSFSTVSSKKDPRLSASVSAAEIRANGVRVL